MVVASAVEEQLWIARMIKCASAKQAFLHAHRQDALVRKEVSSSATSYKAPVMGPANAMRRASKVAIVIVDDHIEPEA